jgi:hypothetical protein
LQALKFHLALARRLLDVHVPANPDDERDDQQYKYGQDAFHGDSLFFGIAALAGSNM